MVWKVGMISIAVANEIDSCRFATKSMDNILCSPKMANNMNNCIPDAFQDWKRIAQQSGLLLQCLGVSSQQCELEIQQ